VFLYQILLSFEVKSFAEPSVALSDQDRLSGRKCTSSDDLSGSIVQKRVEGIAKHAIHIYNRYLIAWFWFF
jgi:hypothetical protein